MPVIIVEMWQGRSVEQKKQLAAEITQAFVNIGVEKSQVQIIFKDNPRQNWAQEGKLASEES